MPPFETRQPDDFNCSDTSYAMPIFLKKFRRIGKKSEGERGENEGCVWVSEFNELRAERNKKEKSFKYG